MNRRKFLRSIAALPLLPVAAKASEDVLLYGGAAGGGMKDCLQGINVFPGGITTLPDNPYLPKSYKEILNRLECQRRFVLGWELSA